MQTREITIIFMWAGQLASEALNYVVKHKVKEARPYRAYLNYMLVGLHTERPNGLQLNSEMAMAFHRRTVNGWATLRLSLRATSRTATSLRAAAAARLILPSGFACT